MNKFNKWDNKVTEWYARLKGKRPFVFWLIFPLMLIGDLLLVPVRFIINKRDKNNKRGGKM